MKCFISYTRKDRAIAEALEDHLEGMGNEVWFDKDLPGGQSWWDLILKQIRECDALLFVVTKASIRSEPCKREREYAKALGKPIVPISADNVPSDFLPAEIGALQLVAYRERDEKDLLGLMKAIQQLPIGATLPELLPAPPARPSSALSKIGEMVLAPESLSSKDQDLLLVEFERALRKTQLRPKALELLDDAIANSDSLRHVVALQLKELREREKSKTPESAVEGPMAAERAEPTPPLQTPWRNALTVGVFFGLIYLWSWHYTDFSHLAAWVVGPLGLGAMVAMVIVPSLRELAWPALASVLVTVVIMFGAFFRGTIELNNSIGPEKREVTLTVDDSDQPVERELMAGETQRVIFFMKERVAVRVEGFPRREVKLGAFRRETLTIPDSFYEEPVALVRPATELAALASTKKCQLEILIDGEVVDATRTGYDGACCWIGCDAEVKVPPGRASEFSSRSFIALLSDQHLVAGKVMEVRIVSGDVSVPLAQSTFTVREATPKHWPQIIDLNLATP